MRFCSKPIQIVLAMLLALWPARAATLHGSLAAAMEAAATEKVPVLAILSTAGTAADKKIIEAFSADALKKLGNFKVVHLNVDATSELALRFSVTLFPTLVLFSPDGKLISRHIGFGGMEELADWMKESSARIERGEWEGAASTARGKNFEVKAQKGELTDEDLQKMTLELANPDPAERSQIASLLLAQKERAVPVLLERLGDSYLGARVASSDLIRKLLPTAPEFDPWLAPEESKASVAALKEWWTKLGKIPEKPAEAEPDVAVINSVRSAISKLKGDDPVTRTEAMAALVRFGDDSLPAVRDALKRAERAGDQRLSGLLEEVRWSILIPDRVERQGVGTRQALARGASPERQAAATKLGKMGDAGLPALSELVNDSDPLVVESAVRSLSGIGGAQAIPAMAVLLKAGNSNLRMTAAQAMGKTRRKEAVPHLLTAAEDSNEVVACAALVGIEEIFSRANSYSTKSVQLPEDVTKTLKAALRDPRWRVRAAATEIIGKLQLNDLQEAVSPLLDDPDGFVVKTTLQSLQQLGATPETPKLAAVMKRMPSLRPEVVSLMVERPSAEIVKTITEIYQAAKIEEQITLIKSLQSASRYGPKSVDAAWKPLLQQAATSPEPKLRSAAASAIVNAPSQVSAELITPLLSDSDPAVRQSGLRALLALISPIQMPDEKNAFKLTDEKKAEWRAALEKSSDAKTNLLSAAALILVSNGEAGVDWLDNALANIGENDARSFAPIIGSVLPKIPWPQGKGAFEKIRQHPILLTSAAASSGKLKAEVGDYLLEPANFKTTLEKASDEQASSALPLLINGSAGWLLIDARARAITPLLVESKNPAIRAAAIFAIGQRNSETNLSIFASALKDKDEKVRTVAAQALASSGAARAERENLLIPALSDESVRVRQMAALALLESEIAGAARLQYRLKMFPFGAAQENPYSYSMFAQDEDRPLPAALPKPDFLAFVSQRLSNMSGEELSSVALLLTQYGVFDGLDRAIAAHGREATAHKGGVPGEILVGIALSKDPKYIPFLRELANDMKDDESLRSILRALKGMTGREAREFRLEVNKLLRKAS